MNGPISVMPLAVVEVPMVGMPRPLVTGPIANISLDSVGPMMAATLSRPIRMRAALIAPSLVPPESATVSAIRGTGAFTRSSASSTPPRMAVP